MKNAEYQNNQNIVEHKMKSFNVLIHPANSSNSKNIQFADREMLQMLSCEDLKPVWSDSPQRTAFQLCHIHILFKTLTTQTAVITHVSHSRGDKFFLVCSKMS